MLNTNTRWVHVVGCGIHPVVNFFLGFGFFSNLLFQYWLPGTIVLTLYWVVAASGRQRHEYVPTLFGVDLLNLIVGLGLFDATILAAAAIHAVANCAMRY